MFKLSDKIHREVGRAKGLSEPLNSVGHGPPIMVQEWKDRDKGKPKY